MTKVIASPLPKFKYFVQYSKTTTKMRSRITYNPVSPFRRGQKAKTLVRKSPTNSSNAIDKDAPVRLPQRKVSIDPELLYLD